MPVRFPLPSPVRLLLVLSVSFAACGDSGTDPAQEDPVVTSVVISPSSRTLSGTGETFQLSASVRDQNGRTMSGQTVTWASSAESVATVDASGLVTAVADGNATITATSSGRNGTAAVVVEIRGSLRVALETAGDEGALDPNGYALNIGSTGATVGPNETKVIDGLPLGETTVEITDIASNCTLTSAGTATVTIREGEIADAGFTLSCETWAGMYRWVTDVGGEVAGSALGPDGTLYVGTNADQAAVFALTPEGAVSWSFILDEFVTGAPAVAADGTILVGSGAGTLYALNADGTEKWSYDVSGVFGVYGTPAVGANGTVYVSDDNFLDPPTLHAVNPDGTVAWTYSDGGRAGFEVSVAADGTVYALQDLGDTGRVVALAADGTLKWTHATDGRPVGGAVAADGTLYVGGTASFDGTTLTIDGKLYAVKPDGTRSWTAPTLGAMSASPVLGVDGTIYVMSGGGQEDADRVGSIYAIRPDGTRAWRTQLSGCPAEDGGATVGADGLVYAPVGGCVFGGVGILHAYDAAGAEQWQFEVGGEFKVIRGASPLTDDGTIYVLSQLTGEVYAVKTDSPGLAASAWPKPGRDNRNSSVAGGA